MPVTTINLPSSVSQSLQSFANQYGLDSNVVQAVAQVESSGNQYDRSGAPLTSPAGAVGIMQVEPSTFNGLTAPAGQVFQSTGLPYFTDINDPQQNMEAGTYYLSQQYSTYGNYPTALAAYSAGPGAVNKYGGIPPYNETQNYVYNVSKLAANAGSTSDTLASPALQNTMNSAGQATSPASTSAQLLAPAPPPDSQEPVVTALQIADSSLSATAWYDDTTLVTGNSRIRKTVQPVAFKIYLNQQTGEFLKNPANTGQPIVLQLNTGLQTLEIMSKHVYVRTPSRTGQHVTFWGMQPDLISGTGSTGVFMNQYGLTDWFSVASIPSDVTTLVTQAFTTGKGKTVGDYAQDLALIAQPNAMRVAAQDCFVEFLKMFQMNGNVWFYNPNYASYHTGQQQTSTTTWSTQTGLSTFQQNARNNDVFSRGWVAMEFKNNVYLGYFKALSWNQDAEKPFSWSFNFVFQVERTFTALYVPTPITSQPQQTTSSSLPSTLQAAGPATSEGTYG
jgi:hypothetical protein